MLKNCKLYVIVDRGATGNRDILGVAEEALRGGADIIQLRDKTSSDAEILQCAKAIRAVTKKYKCPFIINDRVDIARAVNADGVHLGQSDIPIGEARRIIGKKIVGISTHNLPEAKEAGKSGADYIGIGPIFKTPTKEKMRPIGTSVLNRVRKTVDIPFFAVGGISISRVRAVKKSGASRIAVVSAAAKARDVRHAVMQLKRELAQRP